MPTKRNTDPPFEECLQQLDEIVRKLEAGGLPLEESVTLFEEAMRLAKRSEEHTSELQSH